MLLKAENKALRNNQAWIRLYGVGNVLIWSSNRYKLIKKYTFFQLRNLFFITISQEDIRYVVNIPVSIAIASARDHQGAFLMLVNQK